ncbi:MAG: hypothetical protein ACJAYN_000037 [Bermanella sp.]
MWQSLFEKFYYTAIFEFSIERALKRITYPTLRRLVIFENVDAIAQVDCQYAYALRTILTLSKITYFS